MDDDIAVVDFVSAYSSSAGGVVCLLPVGLDFTIDSQFSVK